MTLPPLLTGELDASLAGAVIERVRRDGCARVRSSPAELTDAGIDRRRGELFAFGAALGTPLVQSPRRELVEDVKDYSDVESTDDRGYRSGGEMLPHSDPPTLILLHCLSPAKSGGESSLVRVADIVARMHAEDPALVEELFTPLPDWWVAGQHGHVDARPGLPRPVLARRDGVLSCVLYRPYVERGAAATGVVLTAAQVAALDAFERWSLAPELAIRFTLQPGETLVLHNRAVLHARTDYEDWPAMHRRRHLLRMWIDAPLALPVDRAHELGDVFAPLPRSAASG